MFCIEDACERERIRNGLAPLGSSRVASKKRLSAWGVGGGATPRKKFPPLQKFTDKNSNNFDYFDSL